MVIIGIDIGLTGCCARLGPGMAPKLVDLPTVNDGELRKSKGKKPFQPRRICGRMLLDLLHELAPAGHSALIVFEDVRARPMGNAESHFNSFQSQNSLVLSRGIITAAIDIAGFQSRSVQPQMWKALFGLGGADKIDSREMAQKLYPSIADEFKRVKDHNKADSILIAHWALRTIS